MFNEKNVVNILIESSNTRVINRIFFENMSARFSDQNEDTSVTGCIL